MGAGHEHGHAVGRALDRSRLRMVLTVTVMVLVIEVVGAVVSGSLALLADAGHLLTDATGVLVALSASYVATPQPSRNTPNGRGAKPGGGAMPKS
jgi:cobalt-zinc-cadmium efflux system protein